jgi:hypothetical protein
MTTQELKEHVRDLNSTPIEEVQPEDEVYVSLRYFSSDTYDGPLDMPNKFSMEYVVKAKYTKWDKEDHTRIQAYVPALGSTYVFTRWFVQAWGAQTILLPTMREVTIRDFIQHEELYDFVPPNNLSGHKRAVANMKKNIQGRREPRK